MKRQVSTPVSTTNALVVNKWKYTTRWFPVRKQLNDVSRVFWSATTPVGFFAGFSLGFVPLRDLYGSVNQRVAQPHNACYYS